MKKENQDREFIVSKNDAYLHSIVSITANIAAGIPHVKDWARSKVSASPLEIHDINGSLLFYDYRVTIAGKDAGIIRAAANKVIGTDVVSFILGERQWDPGSAQKEIYKIIRKKFKSAKIRKSTLVCYSYPKIGLKVEFVTGSGEKSLIFDIADHSLIPLLKKGKREGAFAWSLLDNIDEKKKSVNVRKFNKMSERKLRSKTLTSVSSALSRSVIGDLFDLDKFRFRFNISKELQFCTHYRSYESASHHCFVLHAQQVDNYCAVATCQMILCYYRYYFSQDDIAPALGYSSASGCPPDQSPGYESLSNNHIIGTFDNTPTFEEARDQINQLQPMKSGIPGHARAVAGYAYIIQLSPFEITEKKVLIYDPWPWNSNLKLGGDVYWENWDSVEHTNFVYTELDY